MGVMDKYFKTESEIAEDRKAPVRMFVSPRMKRRLIEYYKEKGRL